MEEKKDEALELDPKKLAKLYVEPHDVVAREVTNDDIKQVLKDSAEMIKLCWIGHGLYPSAYAIAHPQISKKPLRFFATVDGNVIVNPKIIRHTKTTVVKTEGCMSFSGVPMIQVDRWNKCEVEYQEINEDKTLSEVKTKNLRISQEAQIWQHEIDHLDAKYIYNH